MKFISVRDYLRDCNLKVKEDEERQFSEEELEMLKRHAEQKTDNARALMMLLAMETGMRAGELAALHKTDVKEKFIHVHRQQRRDHDEMGHEIIVEVGYTKDERMHPHNGRMIPITEASEKVLKQALALPGDGLPVP